MNETVENGKRLDDGELIARGVIAVEPGRREKTAGGFGLMSWGLVFVALSITAPIGFLLTGVGAGRSRILHPALGQVRNWAFLLAGLSIVPAGSVISVRAWTDPEPTGRNLAVAILLVVLFITCLVLTVILLRKLCAIVVDLADEAREYRVRRAARLRRSYLGALAVPVIFFGLPFLSFPVIILGIEFVLDVVGFIIWLVMIGMVWGVLRDAQGIVEHSEAFARLDGEGHDPRAEPAG